MSVDMNREKIVDVASKINNCSTNQEGLLTVPQKSNQPLLKSEVIKVGTIVITQTREFIIELRSSSTHYSDRSRSMNSDTPRTSSLKEG